MINILRLLALASFVAVNCLAYMATAQDAHRPSVGAGEQQPPERPAYIKSLVVLPEGAAESVASVERPLYRYADAARIIAEGAIWAWGSEGRPVAMAKCWKNRNGTQTVAFSLTSDERVVARGPEGKVWRPQELQVEPAELMGAPPPDPKEAGRLRQLKEQARRFTAHEFWDPDNSRFELRLLVQPVHRYRDEKRKILDAAVFLLAYDNNPQVLLLIEMMNSPDGKAKWQYLLGRVSSAELHVELDGREVWKQGRTPGIIGTPTDPYWHMVTSPVFNAAP